VARCGWSSAKPAPGAGAIDPVIAAPRVVDSFDAAGKPLLLPAKQPIRP
jgi:hypothetical protein